MGNQQSNAGAAKFFAGVTDVITAPVNAIVGPIIPSASAAVAASSDPNVNANAGKIGVGQMIKSDGPAKPGTVGAMLDKSKPPSNMICMQVVGQDKPTFNSSTNNWYCGTGNDGDRRGFNMGGLGAAGGVIGNNPTPGPTDQWTGGGAIRNKPPGIGYTPNRGPQQNWQARPGDGVTPPSSRPVQGPGQAPRSDDPQQLNPQFNLAGSTDAGTKTVLGGSANSLSAAQGFPNLNASPALPENNTASVPAMDNTTLLMIGGAVVVGAVLLAKKK
jgi:hypothetical protein